MEKIKVYTSYNENSNSFGYRNFTVEDSNIEVGDYYNHEEVKTVEEVTPDIRSLSLLDEYRLIHITTTINGDYDLDNDDFCEYYLAIAH